MARLLVLVPGIQLRAGSWEPLIARLQNDSAWLPDTVISRWDHGTWVLGQKPLLLLAKHLAIHINTQWALHNGFDEVILAGHSMGALLIRQAYLIGLGSTINGMEPMLWADHVSRIVLLAGVNRGLRLRWWEKLALPFLVSRHGTLRDLLVGSDFITNLRIWWLRKLKQIPKRPVVVQVLGKSDELVDRLDSLDIEGFDEGHQFLIDNAHHGDLFLPDKSGHFRPQQYEILSLAILKPVADEPSREVNYEASQKIYFLVHGIRDSNNDWVAAMKELINQRIPGAVVIEPDIGRFSALQFLIPSQRRRYVRWFQDVYSRTMAKNPIASFNFVGHSYGTYLLGYGLRHLSGMHFDRVYLGGSVLPAEWDWDRHRAQVREVRNACAVHDFPVGVLCSALRGLRITDIGTAGYTGFRLAFSPESELRYYEGGHGGSVSEAARPDILGFLCDGFQYRRGALLKEDTGFTRVSAGAGIALPLLLAVYIFFLVTAFFYSPLHPAGLWLFLGLIAFVLVLAGITAFI